jgi:riboflavin kinase/FMN adenylyltransferase
MVQYFTSLDDINTNNTWLTIGSFDGVHVGHQQLIRELINKAHDSGAQSVVLTFHPHPSVVLKGRKGAFYLTTKTEKVELLERLGVDIVISHPFTYELSQSTARDFISYLVDHLRFRELWVGHDFALGKGREGNVEYLKLIGEDYGYRVQSVEPISSDGQVISSSQIRNLIIDGNIESANKLLGRPYQVVGEVIHGDGRGKGIGIPTANLETGEEKLIPGAGVYACKVQILNKLWPAAVNIGTRPTFESTNQISHVEAHILDFSSELYTQQISIEFISRLRGEEKFQSVNELINQVHKDIDRTREIIQGITE